MSVSSLERTIVVGLLAGDLRTLPAPRSVREIAEVLGLPKSSVHDARRRARRLFGRLLASAQPGDDPPSDQAERIERNARRRHRRGRRRRPLSGE